MTGEALTRGQFVTISRELWATVIKALDSDDPDVRRSAFHQMLALRVPASWDVELDDVPDGWLEEPPRVRADDGREP